MNIRTILRSAKIGVVPVVALLLPYLGFGADAVTPEAVPPPAAEKKAAGRWSFALLPRAFQTHPNVDFNVITEMTDAGRQAPRPTPESPLYYQLSLTKAPELGPDPSVGGKGPNPEYVEEALRKGLAEQHLLDGQSAGRQPTLLLLGHWGEYGFDDFSEGVVSEYLRLKGLLDRARLIGGDRFAREFEAVLEEESVQALAAAGPSNPPPGFLPVMGDLVMPSVWSPMERFRARSSMNRHLVEELTRGCYFVVVSAYDMKAAQEKRRVLLWRTQMTVNSDAVSMRETIVPLVANGSAFLGKDMTEPALLVSRIDRQGRVDFGPAEVLYWEDRPTGAGSAPAPADPAPAGESSQ